MERDRDQPTGTAQEVFAVAGTYRLTGLGGARLGSARSSRQFDTVRAIN
jgi:hypothetical protein